MADSIVLAIPFSKDELFSSIVGAKELRANVTPSKPSLNLPSPVRPPLVSGDCLDGPIVGPPPPGPPPDGGLFGGPPPPPPPPPPDGGLFGGPPPPPPPLPPPPLPGIIAVPFATFLANC